MTLPNDTWIARQRTVADWNAMKALLNERNDSALWQCAFECFFKARLDSRYFEPIKAIENMGQDVGDGFAIVTLHCSLIEFFASTLKGLSYRHQKKNATRNLTASSIRTAARCLSAFWRRTNPSKKCSRSTGLH